MRRTSLILAVPAALLLTVVATLSLGKLGIPLTDVADVLTGNASPVHMFVLHRLSGPRVTVANGVGAALGMAGALFQSVTRNPLGSPDVIGVNWGASAGAALVALAFPGTVPVPPRAEGGFLGNVTQSLIVGAEIMGALVTGPVMVFLRGTASAFDRIVRGIPSFLGSVIRTMLALILMAFLGGLLAFVVLAALALNP